MTIKNVKEERKDASAKSSHHLVAFKVIKKRKKKRIHRVALHVENNERVSFYCTAQIWRIVALKLDRKFTFLFKKLLG